MQYRDFGKTGIRLSAVSFGTNRISEEYLKDEAGLHLAAGMLVKAVMEYGINYFDVGYSYSLFCAEKVIRYALDELRQKGVRELPHLSVKVMYGPSECLTAEDVRNSVSKSLAQMGVEKVSFGYCWRVSSYEEYQRVILPGGIYEGLDNCKKEGLIEHICISLHASVEDSIRILKEGRFEGAIVSCNILNRESYSPFFDFVKENQIGIMTMNTLGGGLIPLLQEESNPGNLKDGISAALVSLYQERAITTMLLGIENEEQLKDNVEIFRSEAGLEAISNPLEFPKMSEAMCTKCRYCYACPAEIPIADMMYAYSSSNFFRNLKGANANETEKEKAARIFHSRFFFLGAIPKTIENPCISCGNCERICTQSLPVMERVKEMYELSAKYHYSHEQRKERLNDLFKEIDGSVGLYPAGVCSSFVIDACMEFFGKVPVEYYVFDRDEKKWGTPFGDTRVLPTDKITDYHPAGIIITSLRYGDEIYRELSNREDIKAAGIRIYKLQEDGGIPWY